MKYFKEFKTIEGNIIRVGITDDGSLRITENIVKYANKILHEEEILKLYYVYANAVTEHRKKYISKKGRLCSLINCTIISYDKFRRIIIENYQMHGIPYIEKKKINLLGI
jgi:hypothetical protein